jgi:hypothetical protein
MSPKLKDLTGKTFGKWTVVGPYKIENKHTYWFCKCACNTEQWVEGSSLRRGISAGCRLCSREVVSVKNSRPYPERWKKEPEDPDKEVQECTMCNKDKPFSAYGKYKTGKYGRTAYRRACKECRTSQVVNRYRSNPLVRERSKKLSRMAHVLKVYGLTPLEYQKLLEDSGGICAICKTVLKEPNVDHCHTTGKVRGVLCWNCNTGIGKFKDSPEILIRAAEYLRGR